MKTKPKYPNVTALIEQAACEMARLLAKELARAVKRMEKTKGAQSFEVPRKPFQNLLRLYNQRVPRDK